jgi:hypothetical protein
MTDYQPKYKWHRTQLDENDPPTDLDWIGMDGVMPIGRIRKETAGPTKGKWRWAGWYPKTHMGSPPTPNAGYEATARLATQKVEEFWELSQRVMTRRAIGPSN